MRYRIEYADGKCCSTVKIFRCNQNQRDVFYKNKLWKGVR